MSRKDYMVFHNPLHCSVPSQQVECWSRSAYSALHCFVKWVAVGYGLLAQAGQALSRRRMADELR